MNIFRQYDELKSKEAVTASLITLLAKPVDEGKQHTFPTEIPEMPAAITFSDVEFHYKPQKEVLKKVSFSIPMNETTIILGPSGCGKSSIAKILLGFWPIQKGSIQLMGKPLQSYTDDEIRMFSSYISQGDFITEETVRENLSWGTSTSGTMTDEMMMDALLKVCLVESKEQTDVLDALAKSLSGGEQQRLSLARVILDDAPLLILDEPLTGVDVYTIKDIMPHFKEVLKSKKRTVILISHKLSFVNSAAHLILLSSDGEIVEQGSPKELLNQPNSKFNEIYLAAKNELILDK